MIYEKILAEAQNINAQIAAIHAQLKKLPKGTLCCARNKTTYKWYVNNGKGNVYLPKKKLALAEKLAYKKYLTIRLKDLEHEKTAIDFYLRHHKESQSEKFLIEHPEYKKLTSPFFKPVSEQLSKWANVPYERNQKNPEHLIHKTSSGNLVRSKSEVLIDLFLYINRIPFRYESALYLDNITIFPDFTIRHPKTGQIFYWEHFGLMDDPSYRRSTYSKLQLYSSHGIIPSIQLITTYETQKHPLTTEAVEKIIEHYFL